MANTPVPNTRSASSSSYPLAKAYQQLIDLGVITNVSVEPTGDFQYPSVFVPVESLTLSDLSGISIAGGSTNAKLAGSSNGDK